MTPTRLRRPATFVAALTLVAMAHAADPAALKSDYERQRAACNASKSNQDRATCLKEAGAAYEQARQGKLESDGDFRKNETERCKAFRDPADRESCVSRMTGSGTVSGSVGGGGVLRERVTKQVVRPAEVVPAPPAASAPN